MTKQLSEIEKIHDLIELMKLSRKGVIEPDLTKKESFRELLQDYSIHQENIEDLIYGKTIQCLMDSANEEYDPGSLYYVGIFLSVAIGGVLGAVLFLPNMKSWLEETGDLDSSLYKMRDPVKALSFGDLFLGAIITLSIPSVLIYTIHSTFQSDVFFDDALECLNFMPGELPSEIID